MGALVRAFTRDCDGSFAGAERATGEFGVGLPDRPDRRGYFYESFYNHVRFVRSNLKSKPERAVSYAARVEASDVYLVRAAWNSAYVSELAEFPTGRHDDQVPPPPTATPSSPPPLPTPHLRLTQTAPRPPARPGQMCIFTLVHWRPRTARTTGRNVPKRQKADNLSRHLEMCPHRRRSKGFSIL